MPTKFCRDLSWDIKKGKEVAEYLMNRTAENPYFAVLSAVMHSGPITYAHQQKYVEKMVKQDPAKFLDAEAAEQAVRGSQMWKGRSLILPRATKCYFDHCERGQCLSSHGREELIDCLAKIKVMRKVAGDKSTGVGFGPKILDLTREYLGDPDAVAVDRHVRNWACKKAKLVCPNPKELKTEVVTPRTYRAVVDAVRAKARECGLTAAELQVAAWLSGSCKEAGFKAKPLYIGEGKSIRCVRTEPLARWL